MQPTLIIYCDPEKHGVETFNAIKKSVFEARSKKKFLVEPQKNGSNKREQQINFILSTSKCLDLNGFSIVEDHPQAIMLNATKDQNNLLESYLSNL